LSFVKSSEITELRRPVNISRFYESGGSNSRATKLIYSIFNHQNINLMNLKNLVFVLLTIFTATLIYLSIPTKKENKAAEPVSKLAEKHYPDDFFSHQRTYPDRRFAITAYENALKEARQLSYSRNKPAGFDQNWTVQGPGNIGARVNTVAVDPTNENIMYAGFARSGVFKTVNGGASWQPIFDDQNFLAIGDIAIDPNNSQTIYVGTGDPNISGYPAIGDGIYKSTNGGTTWALMGLTAERIVSKIIIDPSNSNIVYASCMGLPFERNNQRGLYKSLDGGVTWNQVLFVNNETGIIDMVIDYNSPQTLYAAAWTRIRNNQESIISSSEAKIYKTTDGGANWIALANGLPNYPASRIGLAMSHTNPDKVYAMYVNTSAQLENIYVTTNGGNQWTTIPTDVSSGLDQNALGGFGWYFGKMRVNPTNDNDIYLLGIGLHRTKNAGQTWEEATPPWWTYAVHADKHDLTFTPSGNIILATDGGLYKGNSTDSTWTDIENIPATQFYRVAYNPHEPNNYYGGAQDNGTTGGNNSNINNWPRIYGGDGFQAIFHPFDPQIVYAETQNGGIVVSPDGGNNFYSGKTGLDPNDRYHWDMQYIMSSGDADLLYTGTHRVYKNATGTNVNWVPISQDLTDGVVYHPRHHTISTLSESPLDNDILYVGTSDANVWRSLDAGLTWDSVMTGLPIRYVSSVKASPTFTNTLYVTHSGYKDNEFIPHVHRSDDNGSTWADISSDLPALAVNDVFIIDGKNDSLIFVATDGGIYGTQDAGTTWHRLGQDMPIIPVYDLEVNVLQNELIAGTYARSIMTYSLDSIQLNNNFSSVKSPKWVTSMQVNPTLATSQIEVVFDNISLGKAAELTVFDVQGRQMKQLNLAHQSNQRQIIQVGNWAKGIYFVRLRVGTQVITKRFVKG